MKKQTIVTMRGSKNTFANNFKYYLEKLNRKKAKENFLFGKTDFRLQSRPTMTKTTWAVKEKLWCGTRFKRI